MDKRFRYVLCSLILPLLFIAFPANAEEPENQVRLSLRECISLALESNLDIRIQRMNPQIQENLVTMAKGRFDPSAALGPSISEFEEPSSTSLSGADVRSSGNQALTFSIADPIITGGSYGLSFNSDRSTSNSTFQTLNPAYRSGLSFSVSQPLLAGLGTAVNKAPITIALNNREVSLLSLEAQLMETLSEVQKSYWELVFELENLKVQQLALRQAQDLLAISQRFREVKKASISDVLQAQAAVASREADVIAAQDAVRDAEDKLKRVTNMIEDETRWNATILPVDVPSPEEMDVDLQGSIATAFEKRPEYTQAKLELQNSGISIKLAKNRRLPILDLEGSFDLNGLGGKFDEPLSQVGGADYRSWYVGLALRMPIGNRSAKAELRKSLLEKEQKLLALKDLEQRIITEVRGAVRQQETDGKRVKATKVAQEFAEQVLSTEEKKHKLGLSTNYELLQFQANLATARKNHLRAIIDYRKSIVTLHQALGATLEKLNIEL